MATRTCAVTCTGGRPELFALCRRWVERASPDLWIVATDDGSLPDIPEWATHVPVPNVNPVYRIQNAYSALGHALRHVPPDCHAVIMEDDDWYAANYITRQLLTLDQHPDRKAIALAVDTRYNLPARKYDRFTIGAAPAGNTVIRNTAVQIYASLCARCRSDNDGFIACGGFRVGEYGHVSIKGVGFGLPGRPGATQRHNPKSPVLAHCTSDPDYTFFRSVLGDDDANAYIALLQC